MVEQVKDMLDDIQQSLFDVAKQNRDACVQVARTWDEFMEALNQKKMILAPWCDEEVRCLLFGMLSRLALNTGTSHRGETVKKKKVF